MASSLAIKRLLSRSLRPLRVVSQPVSSRLFKTNAVRKYDSGDSEYETDDREYNIARRVFSPLSKVFVPFSARNSLNQSLNKMHQSPMDDDSPVSADWDIEETDDGLDVRVEMPGIGKEDVKVSVEGNTTLVIRGDGKEKFENDEYDTRINLLENLFKTDEITAEMKNGILKLFIPKIEEDARTDVIHVNVE